MRRARRRRPQVTVVIASYRWPEALRLSVASALAQSVRDVEVLVIEDGPDRASRAVVGEVDDDRARWIGLRKGTGSQSGPNRRGRAVATAPIVAYLGHDDIWHPDHLAELLSALEPDLDAVHSIALYLRADEGEAVVLSGGEPWNPTAFVPPSSLAHWRDSPRIAAWAPPDDTGMPVDYAFLMASHRRGARFGTTGSPTVFKYPAAWHLDCYRTQDAGPQRCLAERLAGDPDLGTRMVSAARAAGVGLTMSAPPVEAAGVIADHSRRLKGLPARFGPPVRSWQPSRNLAFPGWHHAEQDERGTFAWTGARSRAFVRLDAPKARELGVRIVVRHVLTGEQLERLVVDLDGAPISMTSEPNPDGTIVLTGWLAPDARRETVEVGLTAPTRWPHELDPESDDARALGIAVSEIELLARH